MIGGRRLLRYRRDLRKDKDEKNKLINKRCESGICPTICTKKFRYFPSIFKQEVFKIRSFLEIDSLV